MIRIIISGGGTGGHIFPAIAIANALKKQAAGVDILFVGAKGRMEMERVPAAGFRITGLTVSGFQRRMTWKNLLFPFKLTLGMMQAFAVIRKFKPDLVIGVGGFASGPVLRMATAMKIPSIIQEQNSFPGVTNRILAQKARKICVAFQGMERYFPADKIVLAGNPVREEVIRIEGKRDESLSYFSMKPGLKTILVIGGSLGAGTINQAILKFVSSTLINQESLQIIWQTGKFYFESVTQSLLAFCNEQNIQCGGLQSAQGAGGKTLVVDLHRENKSTERSASRAETDSAIQAGRVVVMPFIDRMDLAYSLADLIISRAGAIAIAELCLIGKPAILVPSPNVAEDHQTKNAMALVNTVAAIMVKDVDAADTLGSVILTTLSDQNLLSRLRKNVAGMAIHGAAETIAQTALNQVGLAVEAVAPKDEDQNVDLTTTHHELPDQPGPAKLYFLGIGGIGMSALARYFAARGCAIYGYDRGITPLTGQLTHEGMHITYNQDVSTIPDDIDLAVYTPAVPSDHPAFEHFRNKQVTMQKRAGVLGMISKHYPTIAVAGTHGKTTTSTLIAHIFRSAGLDHIAFLGGISKNYGTNFLYSRENHVERDDRFEIADLIPATGDRQSKSTERQPDVNRNPAPMTLGDGSTNDGSVDFPPFIESKSTVCIVEADEFDRSFLQLNPSIAIITSTDADHLDIYGNHADLKETFSLFASKTRHGGHLIANINTDVDPGMSPPYSVYSYSLDGQAKFHAANVRIEDHLFHFDFIYPGGVMTDLVMGIPGRFNLENAVAALAAAHLCGIGSEKLRTALTTYQGVQRRFDFRVNKPGIIYIDDYAHHPEELRACIGAVRELYPENRITGIFQPHLFSRTRDFAEDFGLSLSMLDELWLLGIYPAREKPIAGVSSSMLLDLVTIKNKRLVEKTEVINLLSHNKPEILLTLGAGDIDQLVQPITEFLIK